MQTDDGTFKRLSSEESEQASKDYGGRILRIGEEAVIVNSNEGRFRVVIRSIGERFVVVRAIPGASMRYDPTQEVTIKDCAFFVHA